MECKLATGVWPNAYTPTEDVYRDMRFFLVQAREYRATAAKLKAMLGKENYPTGTYSEGFYRGLAQAYRGAASMLRRRISPDRPSIY